MTMCPSRRACARLSLCLLPGLPFAAGADTLALFSFDSGGQFTTRPQESADGVAGAAWRDDLSRIGSTAGNPGLALVASGFSAGNVLHLELAAAPHRLLELSSLEFDVRVSASGPSRWQWQFDGQPLGEGAATTGFRHVVLGLAVAPRAALSLDLVGSGASSAAGTLRLDNVRVAGSVRPVPIPGSCFLLLTPTLGAVLRRWRLYYGRAASSSTADKVHSRQPSSSGKYSPSLIGRESMAAIARP